MNGLLRELESDAAARARLVEDLGASAALLEMRVPADAIDATVAFKLACRLRDVATRLCDHVRATRGACRYCGVKVR